jgi:hypothetical protein
VAEVMEGGAFVRHFFLLLLVLFDLQLQTTR